MANFSDKADEVVGRAKQAAGDLTGNDELKTEGAAEKTTAQVKQGVDAAVDKAEDVAKSVSDAASSAAADVKDGVSDTVDKASEKASELADKASDQVSHVADKAADTAEQLHLDDKRVLIVAAIAGITLTLLLRRGRARRNDRSAVTKRVAKRATKRAAKSGLGRALTS